MAGSLKLGTIGAVELLRCLQGGSPASTLGRALAELSRIPKTIHLLTYFDDEQHRRRIGVQLNRQEGRHKLARATFHGPRRSLRCVTLPRLTPRSSIHCLPKAHSAALQD